MYLIQVISFVVSFQYQCTREGLAISIIDTSYPCYHANQVIEVQVATDTYVHMGKLICPPCEELCGEQCPFDREAPTNSVAAQIGKSTPSRYHVIFSHCVLYNHMATMPWNNPEGLTPLNRRYLQTVQGLYCLLNLARLPYP